VEHEDAVVAELHKVKSAALRLALPAGAYTVVLRQQSALSQCELGLRDGTVTRVATSACSKLDEHDARAKGYFSDMPVQRPSETWAFELAFGLGSQPHDDYVHRLRDFGFSEQLFAGGGSPLRLSLTGSRQLAPHLTVLASLMNLDSQVYKRDYLTTKSETRDESFRWDSYALTVALRAHVDTFGDALRWYAQLGGGLGFVHSKLRGTAESYLGPQLTAAAGLFWMPWQHFGFLFQGGYVLAPVLSNELGEHHDSGGIELLIGVRYRLWSTP
jgi:hypothetical protein